MIDPVAEQLIVPRFCDFGYAIMNVCNFAQQHSTLDSATILGGPPSFHPPPSTPSTFHYQAYDDLLIWTKMALPSTPTTLCDWHTIVVDYVLSIPKCRLKPRGNHHEFAHDIPLPVLVKFQRFSCSVHRDVTKQSYHSTTFKRVKYQHTSSITQFHPQFNSEFSDEIPINVIKTAEFFKFNSTYMSERFFTHIINMLLILPCIREVTSTIVNEYTTQLNHHLTRRRREAEAKFVEEEPVSLKLAHDYERFTRLGLGRESVGLLIKYWWSSQGNSIRQNIQRGRFLLTHLPSTFHPPPSTRYPLPIDRKLCLL